MNVYRFEFGRQLRGFLVGEAVLLGVAVLLMVGAYPIYRDAKEAVEQVLDGFPPQFAALFGVSDGMFSFGGFYRFCSLYFMLIVAIMACAWGLSVFGRERRAKSSDFLFVMPIGRMRLYAAKLAVCLTMIAATGALFMAVMAMIYRGYGDDPTAASIPLPRILLAACSQVGVQMVFLAFGLLIAVLSRRAIGVSGTSTMVGILGFVLVSLPEMTGEDGWRLVSPFTWFNVDEALNHGRYEVGYSMLAMIVVAVCLAGAAVVYAHADVRNR